MIMGVQSLVSLVTIGLVVSRAVNILQYTANGGWVRLRRCLTRALRPRRICPAGCDRASNVGGTIFQRLIGSVVTLAIGIGGGYLAAKCLGKASRGRS
jgi:hypothetical protein